MDLSQAAKRDGRSASGVLQVCSSVLERLAELSPDLGAFLPAGMEQNRVQSVFDCAWRVESRPPSSLVPRVLRSVAYPEVALRPQVLRSDKAGVVALRIPELRSEVVPRVALRSALSGLVESFVALRSSRTPRGTRECPSKREWRSQFSTAFPKSTVLPALQLARRAARDEKVSRLSQRLAAIAEGHRRQHCDDRV